MAVIITTGCLLVFGHNLLDYLPLPKEGALPIFINVIINSPRVLIPIGTNRFIYDLYTILPWTGVMLLGYAFGTLYVRSFDTSKRKKILLGSGIFLVLLFVIVRFINRYGDPAPWSRQKDPVFTFLSFINTTKYPPSLQYLSMTIGPGLISLSLLENARNKFARVLMVYGRVPFFYYVLHFYLIHMLCVIFFFASGYGAKDIVDPNLPFLFRPMHFGFDLWVVYAVWLFVVVVLYRPCKWFNNYKATHQQWWLTYI